MPHRATDSVQGTRPGAGAPPSGRQDPPASKFNRWNARRCLPKAKHQPSQTKSLAIPLRQAAREAIAATGWDLSLNRYKEVVRDLMAHRPPQAILAELVKLEDEIREGMRVLEGMLS